MVHRSLFFCLLNNAFLLDRILVLVNPPLPSENVKIYAFGSESKRLLF